MANFPGVGEEAIDMSRREGPVLYTVDGPVVVSS